MCSEVTLEVEVAMIYDLDDIDRARRTEFERRWAGQHGIPFSDIERLGYVAVAPFDDADGRPQWSEMMLRGPCIAELVIKVKNR